MALQICVLGIDGSGKSTLASTLPILLAAECGAVSGSAGEEFFVTAPEEDVLAPDFAPEGRPWLAGLARSLKRWAKLNVNRRWLYPYFKIPQMLAQDGAVRRMEKRWRLDCVVSDGNALLSTMGRAANYRRPASDGVRAPEPDAADLCIAFDYILNETPILPASAERLPKLGRGRKLYLALEGLRIHGAWLPDVVIFLDLAPDAALRRITARGQPVDRHENAADLAQTRGRYQVVLDAVRRLRGDDAVIILDTDGRSPGELLNAAVERVRPLLLRAQRDNAPERPLGTTATTLTGGSVWSKVFNARYLFGYLFWHYFNGAWREPFFPFSSLGKLFLKEGYSAGVMRVIYDHDQAPQGFADRVFLGYPLHRAVYDRLQILVRRMEPELRTLLASRERVTLFSAPSGFAYDVFRALEKIAATDPGLMRKVRFIAADLDPHGVIEPDLSTRAKALKIDFLFRRGDLTDDAFRAASAAEGPFDAAWFVGLSSWLPKPATLRHLRWLRENLAPDGVLATDSFTPAPYALSGRYVGYKAHYYSAERFRMLLDAAGFDGLAAAVESGRDRINHVLIVRRASGK